MLIEIFFLIFGLGVFFTLLPIIFEDNDFWGLMSPVVATVIWFALVFLILDLRIFYTHICCNWTAGYEQSPGYWSSNVTQGLYLVIDEGHIYISYIFMLLALLNMFYFIAMVFDKYHKQTTKKD